MSKNKKRNKLKNSLLSLFLMIFMLSSCDVSEERKNTANTAIAIDSIEPISKQEKQYADNEEDRILKEARKNGYDDSIPFKERLTNYIEQELNYSAFELGDSIKIISSQLSMHNINFKCYIKADIGAIDVTSKPHHYKQIVSWLSDKNIICLVNEKIVKFSFNENSFRNTLPQTMAYFKHNGVSHVLVSFYVFMYASSRSYFENILFKFDEKNNLIGHYLIGTVSTIPNYESLGDFDGDGSLDYLARVRDLLPTHEVVIQTNTIYNIEKDSTIFSKYTLVKEDYD